MGASAAFLKITIAGRRSASLVAVGLRLVTGACCRVAVGLRLVTGAS